MNKSISRNGDLNELDFDKSRSPQVVYKIAAEMQL